MLEEGKRNSNLNYSIMHNHFSGIYHICLYKGSAGKESIDYNAIKWPGHQIQFGYALVLTF